LASWALAMGRKATATTSEEMCFMVFIHFREGLLFQHTDRHFGDETPSEPWHWRGLFTSSPVTIM
jgi:hypothetical protein